MEQRPRPLFRHDRLEAYQLALRYNALEFEIEKGLPRGYADLVDQMKRSACSILLNTAEGAGRRSPRDKARFFNYASSSGTEAASGLDLIELRQLAELPLVVEARSVLHQTVSLLCGLEASALRRAGR